MILGPSTMFSRVLRSKKIVVLIYFKSFGEKEDWGRSAARPPPCVEKRSDVTGQQKGKCQPLVEESVVCSPTLTYKLKLASHIVGVATKDFEEYKTIFKSAMWARNFLMKIKQFPCGKRDCRSLRMELPNLYPKFQGQLITALKIPTWETLSLCFSCHAMRMNY